MDNEPIDFIFVRELVSNECEENVFPVLIRVCLLNAQAPLAASQAVRVLPHWLYTLGELTSNVRTLIISTTWSEVPNVI